MLKLERIQILLFFIVITCFALFNKNIMPIRKEITELELSQLIGMDTISEEKYRVEQTVPRVSADEQSSQDSAGTQKSKTKVFTTKGVSFADAIRSFQTYIDKSLSGSHIKYILLGEELCKNDISKYIDFNARDYEVRLNANIYITKGISAKEFINKTVNSEYDLDGKILSMEKNNEAKNVSYEIDMADLLSILTKKRSCGLIPTLEIISEDKDTEPSKGENASGDKQDFQTSSVEKSENSETFFDFGGYAIVCDRKIEGYLNREESITSNMLQNRQGGTNINIDIGNNDIISFSVIQFKTTYKFKYENDKLSEVIINMDLKTNFEEVSTGKYVFKSDQIKDLEDKQAEQMKKEIQKVVDKIVENRCDFLDISNEAKIKNPYKYKKIEENWSEELTNAKFTVNVNVKTVRTYDITSINEE